MSKKARILWSWSSNALTDRLSSDDVMYTRSVASGNTRSYSVKMTTLYSDHITTSAMHQTRCLSL